MVHACKAGTRLSPQVDAILASDREEGLAAYRAHRVAREARSLRPSCRRWGLLFVAVQAHLDTRQMPQ